MAATRTQIGIAAGAGFLLVLVFVGYLWWLSNQGPVLARSEDHDPLTGLPLTVVTTVAPASVGIAVTVMLVAE